MFKAANVGAVDRAIRFLAGAAIMAVVFLSTSPYLATPYLRWGAVIVGVVLIFTALFRFCPLYRLIGANTCQVN